MNGFLLVFTISLLVAVQVRTFLRPLPPTLMAWARVREGMQDPGGASLPPGQR